MAQYRVRFVHKISPSDKDVKTFEIPDGAFSDVKTLGKALREAGVLHKGGRLAHFRVKGSEVAAFPRASPWHSFILTPA